ncbi:hypothetical protein D5R81_01130 [Parashewanella spongiae]|uniref:Uncharacterized protein n=2 Tax=Parashewanella spongiae TaxID=342950 RepID=A0A3A6TT03_9GAMM|nr:hypothetical protein [Parashewanella spongiae]RJY19339.1 hypothetical protein D5R81_01130 [Parashewanella spongiae]
MFLIKEDNRMKVDNYKFIIYISLLFSCGANSNISTPQINTLQDIGEGLFSDNNGHTEQFICPAGGEPLVIYSTPAYNNEPISSKSTIVPIYVKPGFTASPIKISISQQSEKKSLKYLYIKSRVPADSFLDFDLTKEDDSSFWLNSVQFPVIHIDSRLAKKKQKYVSLAFVQLDNEEIGPEKEIPVRNYPFDADFRINIFRNVHKISGSFTGWDQSASWDTAWKPLYEDIPFTFTSIKSTDDPSYYNGYGLWVCGNDAEQLVNTISNNIAVTMDAK